MIKNRHILQMWMLSLLLSLTAIPVLAQDIAEMSGLHCGDVVTITATPDVGYRFVRWSDGNKDNPREIEITEAVTLTAIYEPICVSDEVPVLWLYDQLLMVNVDSLQKMGYVFSEQSVTWYRIVGDIDVSSGENDDQQQATGYYYAPPSMDIYQYYVAVDVSQTPGGQERCTDTLIKQLSMPQLQSIMLNDSTASLRLVPNFGSPGTRMDIVGLNPKQLYTIQVFDAVGRKLEEYTSTGVEQYAIVAQRIPGYYLVRVSDVDHKTVLRYIVKQ